MPLSTPPDKALTPELASRFLTGLWQLNRRIRQDVEPQLTEHNLDLRRFFLLATIAKGVVYPKELSKKLDISATLLSRYLDQVVQLGYVERQIDRQDSRRTVLSLTEAGNQVLQSARQSIHTTTLHRLQNIDPDKRDTMLDGIELLVASETPADQEKTPIQCKENQE